MWRMWSGRSWAGALMRIDCVVLLLLAQHTISKA